MLEALPKGVGQRRVPCGGARGHGGVGGAVGMLLHDTLELRGGTVKTDARDLPPEGFGAHSLLDEALDGCLGRGLRRSGHRAGCRRTKHLHAADVGIFSVKVVAQNAHLQHKHLDRLEREGDRLLLRNVGVGFV